MWEPHQEGWWLIIAFKPYIIEELIELDTTHERNPSLLEESHRQIALKPSPPHSQLTPANQLQLAKTKI